MEGERASSCAINNSIIVAKRKEYYQPAFRSHYVHLFTIFSELVILFSVFLFRSCMP